jgi:hypothetical protein
VENGDFSINKIRKDEESRATKIQAMPWIYSCKYLHFTECNHAKFLQRKPKDVHTEPHERGIPQNRAGSRLQVRTPMTITSPYTTTISQYD